MRALLKYLKQSAWIILFIFILLLFQAYCDLSLPRYTSNMVNVGIQQSGIESATPEVIRENKLDEILLLADNEDKKTAKLAYEKLDKTAENLEKYPALKKENIYKLKENSENLEKIFAKNLYLNGILENEKTANEIKKQMNIPENVNIYDVLKTMDENSLKTVKENLNKKITSEEDIINQASIALVKEEYKAIGMDTNSIQTNYIILTGLKMLGLALISMILTIAVAYFASKVSAKLGKNLRKDVFDKVISFSSAEFKSFSVASLITRSTNDIQQIQILIVMLLRIVFYAPIMAIGGIFNVIVTSPSMTWIIAVAVALVLLLVIILFAVTMPKFKIIQKIIDKVNLIAREILSGLSVIRAFSKEKHEEERFDNANTKLMKVNLFVNRTMALMMPMMMLIMNGIMVLIVWVGAGYVDNGNIQVGDMMAFMQYTMEIVMSFLMISMVSIVLPRALVSVNRINEVIETKNVICDPINPKKFNPNKKGIVEFKNVCFRYPEADYDVITDINFTAYPGQTTALIGSTGSGKSTVINLIPRFFDVTDGEILVDGVNIKDVLMKDLRAKIGFVPQKGLLFSGDIESNITYGNPNASKEDIKEALDVSQSSEFVNKLDKKLHSRISQGGKNVSGGQRQRLSIARAIAINPDIYIFDDSFSALDFKTDATLRRELAKITKDKTVIIVAQRISTIMNAEQIIVLDEGKIVGIGTHKQLLENCDIYRQIALSQLSKEEI